MSAFESFVAAARAAPPEVAFVLGSGLGHLADRLDGAQVVSFADVPGFPHASVAGHRGQILLGAWQGRRVLVFAGRVHYYEGHTWDAVVRPIRLAADLGVRRLILTNAVGGIRADLVGGTLVAIRSHIEWTRPRFWREAPASESPYSPALLADLARAAQSLGETLPTGVYAQVTGPTYETPAEVRALRAVGADVVGMSTAREIAYGASLGLACAAISCVCNQAAGLASGPICHEDVLDVAQTLRVRLTRLLEAYLELG